jgi:hypothetical protein
LGPPPAARSAELLVRGYSLFQRFRELGRRMTLADAMLGRHNSKCFVGGN